MTSANQRCRICHGAAGRLYRVREMMYGSREIFDYFECDDCGCLQIARVPDDLARHYGEDYYSLGAGTKQVRPWKARQRAARDRWQLTGQGIAGALLNLTRRVDDPVLYSYRKLALKPTDQILDVGGGGGAHALRLRRAGYSRAQACDKFIPDDVEFEGTVLSRKAEIFDLDGGFDIITFHHSFEHVDHPVRVLAKARELLAADGRILIRIPTVSSEAWETYREDWVNLDAPRHLYLHSHRSFRIVADRAGLTVGDMWCDSTLFQFWGSEQYRRDIPLNAPNSFAKDPIASPFSKTEINSFRQRAVSLNREMRGDWLCAILTPKNAEQSEREES